MTAIVSTATALPPPTESSTPLPTPNYSPEDLVGTWTRSDIERGNLFLIFREDGTYTAAHGTPQGFVRSGDYRLEGSLFTWQSWDDCPAGQYWLKLNPQVGFIAFEVVSDPECDDRRDALRSYRWDRYEPEPTATP